MSYPLLPEYSFCTKFMSFIFTDKHNAYQTPTAATAARQAAVHLLDAINRVLPYLFLLLFLIFPSCCSDCGTLGNLVAKLPAPCPQDDERMLKVLLLLRDVAEGLKALHEAGVVHGDLVRIILCYVM